LHQGGGPEVLVLVPPVRRARGRAASAKNTLVHAIEFLTILLRLNVFALLRRVIVLQIRFNGLVLLVEVREIGNQVFDNVHVREWVNLCSVRNLVNSTKTRKSVLSIDVHGTRSTDTLSARPPEGKRGVDLVFNFDQRVENHRPTLVQVNCVGLEFGGSGRFIWVPAIDLEFLWVRRFLCRDGLRPCCR